MSRRLASTSLMYSGALRAHDGESLPASHAWRDKPPPGGLDATPARIAEVLEEVRENAVHMPVFPERFLTGCFRPMEEAPAVAAEVSDETFETLSAPMSRRQMAKPMRRMFPETAAPLTYRKQALYGDWEKSVFKAATVRRFSAAADMR